MKVSAILNWVGCAFVGLSLSACASASPPALSPQHLAAKEDDAGPKPVADPNEAFNRKVFENNQQFNHDILYPAAQSYNSTVPEGVRDRIDAFTTNLAEPMTFANNILQLRFEAAATTFGRFAMNSTVGIGGLFDVAATQGMAHQSGDFGQTMYVWGYRDSAYVVLPVLGPTTVRDAIGTGVEFGATIPAAALIPSRYAALASHVDLAGTITSPLSNLSKAEDMKTLEESSIDFYSMLRSVSQQKRQAELQEALDTSALTGTPKPRDPNAIEPVTELVSSPTMLEKRNITDVPKLTNPVDRTAFVVIGSPKPADMQRSPAEEDTSPAEEQASPAQEQKSPAEE
ncbi:VacJ family lipoprotein [Hyphomicrobium sp.]|uniref:MlaA family lipoprotein n=1 Tax=Hyphomicrobium sp. TaxID=82 RepID=UPI000F950441|nr:VacJ family lipoprotein [Hyphomicrobium sp.]RUO98906.1 MAG: VacJ family lipoprotein [Hyphomicrobium sp.]